MCLIKFIKFAKPNYLIIYLFTYLYVFHSGFERTWKRFKGSFLHIALEVESEQVVKAAKLLLLLEDFQHSCFSKTYMFSWDHIKDRSKVTSIYFFTTAIESSLF